ncbi:MULTISPECIES: hypothetical protein [Streptomyces]|uniref:Uncharacterized protein n=1 Tax=Streptomyces luteireticuli TaxID=173858 RepID=A0ABP3HY82_9ACTN
MIARLGPGAPAGPPDPPWWTPIPLWDDGDSSEDCTCWQDRLQAEFLRLVVTGVEPTIEAALARAPRPSHCNPNLIGALVSRLSNRGEITYLRPVHAMKPTSHRRRIGTWGPGAQAPTTSRKGAGR